MSRDHSSGVRQPVGTREEGGQPCPRCGVHDPKRLIDCICDRCGDELNAQAR